MYADLKGKWVLITGSRGLLGTALATAFAAEGARLFLQSRTWTGGLPDWTGSLPEGSYHLLEADLSSHDAIVQLFSEISSYTECIDVLINNAGMQDLQPIMETSEGLLGSMSAVNLFAPIYCTAEMARQVHSCTTRTQRSIINILSIEAENPAAGHSQYGALKGGLLQFTRASALELGPLSIRVNGISPGVIHREGIEQAWPEGVRRYTEGSPLHTLIGAEDVAQTALFLTSSQASKITGVNIRVDAGIGVRTGY
jgi:NAD(P)-dependent dehydrogenase (short-subunit alcohol dehydrogenase family)